MTGSSSIVLGLAAAAALAVTAIGASDTADAAIVCRPRMSGEATAQGLAGRGTAQARINALANWAGKVEATLGKPFANTKLARSIRYDCQVNAVLRAKCVVSAVPCADIPTRQRGKKKRSKRPRR